MEVNQADSKKFILSYGLILGVLSVVLGVVLYITNAYLNPSFWFSVVAFLLMVVVIVLGISGYKKENGGFLTLTESFKIGLGIALIAAIIAAVWQLLLMKVLEPDYLIKMGEMQREQMLQQFPEMTESQLEEAAAMNEKFSSPWIMMAISIIGNLFFGFLIALVAGLIMKNKNPYQA